MAYAVRLPDPDLLRRLYIRETLGSDMNAWNESGRFRIELIKANHTFTLLESQRHLIELIANWLDSSFVKHQVNSS